MLRMVPAIVLLSAALTVPAGGRSQAASNLPPQGAYMVSTLAALSAHNWARVAGRDGGNPPQENGHDEFLAAWSADMLANLHGLHAGVVRRPFPTSGFPGLPAVRPGMNVIVAVPGSTHPDEAIVLGAHPDGEPWSRGSAFDDTSGCVILLGVARMLAAYWHEHGPPSRTVEFVLFDGEEEGLRGSAAYGFALHHGAVMPRPIFMIDEEQNGTSYPVRPFGSFSADPLPSQVITTARTPDRGAPGGLGRVIAHDLGQFRPLRTGTLQRADRRINAARSAAFAALRSSYPQIAYTGGTAQTFKPADERLVEIGQLPICCSDNLPFEALGLPTATFASSGNHYASDAPPWALPFDQPEDTFRALACVSGGSPQPTSALAAALDLPAAMSALLVEAYAPPTAAQRPIVFSGVAAVNQAVQLSAIGASNVQWSFGDGGTATGATVHHRYRRQGDFRVTVRSDGASRSWLLRVSAKPPVLFHGVVGAVPPRKPWHPPELAGCL